MEVCTISVAILGTLFSGFGLLGFILIKFGAYKYLSIKQWIAFIFIVAIIVSLALIGIIG